MIKITGRPISKKRNYRRSGNGGLYLSVTWHRWADKALWELKKYKEKYTGPIKVEYTFQMKGKLNTDLDNLQAGVNDLLQDAGIIDDDKNIISVTANKYSGFKDWVTLVEITPLSSPQ